jgi:hypothetical protein
MHLLPNNMTEKKTPTCTSHEAINEIGDTERVTILVTYLSRIQEMFWSDYEPGHRIS